jgi:2-methylcitrate dehydratase
MKNTADPMAAQSGVLAALMAVEGVGGPVEVIEGKEGLLDVIHNVDWDTDELLRGLGEEFLITRCSYKPFPTEALTHQPITAALQVCEEHQIFAKDVAKVLVETTTRGADILSDPSKYKPKTKETADHSLPYVVAAAIADGSVLPSSFSDEKLRDPQIWNLLGKIEVIADAEIDSLFPSVKRARVSITTQEGHVFSAQVDAAKGSPENPMSDDDIIEKFRSNAGGVIGKSQQDHLIEVTMDMENIEDMGAYMTLLIKDT